MTKPKFRWYAWLFPLIAIAISVVLLQNYLQEKGTVIKILFTDASGIQAEKTRVRYRGVSIGTVRDVYLSADMNDGVAEVVLRKEAAHFAVEGSKFNLVTPKVNFQGISGLETIFAGSHITATPGNPEGKPKTEFTGQTDTNTSNVPEDTTYYIIETGNVESLNPGDSVSFRGLKVGTITKLNLAKGSQFVNVQVNIENRYVKLIRTNSFFWKKVGVHAKLSLFKSEFKMNSLDSIVNSGIEFSTPGNPGPIAKAGTRFTLLSAAPKEFETWSPKLDFKVN